MARHTSDLKRRELALRAIVKEAIDAWPDFDSPDQPEISGADMVEWFTMWRRRAIEALK